MKQAVFSIICFLAFSVGCLAQTAETFDIATFQAPAGWKKVSKPGAIIFTTSNEQKGTYAMIMLFPSGDSSGNAKSDFDGDWAEFIAGEFEVKVKPAVEPIEKKDGWDVVSGGAAFENEMGPSAVILNTYLGFGKTFSAAAIFNSQDNLPAIEAFASSIKLNKAVTAAQAVPINNNDDASILGTWKSSASGQQKYDDYKNAHAMDKYGYISRQYTFNANGTYIYVSKTFQMTALDKLYW